MPEETDQQVIIGIQRPGAVDNLDIGSLVSDLTVENWELVSETYDGYPDDSCGISINIERTHEWEFLLIITISGSAIFANAAIKAMGDRFGNWVADQVNQTSRGSQEVTATLSDGREVTIPVNEESERDEKIVVTLEDSQGSEEKVEIEIP